MQLLWSALFYASVQASISKEIQSVVNRMSVEEKIGQMTQINIDTILNDDGRTLNMSKMEYYASRYVGSYLNTPFAGGLQGNVSGYSVSDWRALVTQMQEVTLKHSPHRIPMIYGIDNVHGAHYVANSTLFGQQLSAAASFNPMLVKQMGEITAKETLAAGLNWIFGPILDLGTNQLWPRFYETFGEDPYLSTEMGKAIIEGLQGCGKVAACMKHFIGYSGPHGGKDRANCDISDRKLVNFYAPAFKAAVDAGVKTAMESFNSINDEPVIASKKYLIDLLRHDMDFKGMLVTDWDEVKNMHRFHRAVSSFKEATEVFLQQTSVDMNMTPNDDDFIDYALALYKEGKIPETRLNKAVERILLLKYELGLFKNPVPGKEIPIAQPKDLEVALNLARESIVLVQNNNEVLPLAKYASVFVTGPSADNIGHLCGGWTIAWQGVDVNFPFPYGQSIYRALETISGKELNFVQGITIEGNQRSDYDLALEQARQSEFTIAVIGEQPYAEKPGDILDLSLPNGQIEYIEALAKTGTKVIVILVEGRPRLLGSIVKHAHAIIDAILPCAAGGQAIAEIVYGKVNPSGRLPFTYSKHPGAINIPYYHQPSMLCADQDIWYLNVDCPMEWRFGHGLSYTTFEYSNLRIKEDRDVYGKLTTVHVSVQVHNTGSYPGKESVLLFVSQQYRLRAVPETKLLKAFKKIHLDVHETKEVKFHLDSSAWSYYEPQIGQGFHQVADPGQFLISIGANTDCENYDTFDPMYVKTYSSMQSTSKTDNLCAHFQN